MNDGKSYYCISEGEVKVWVEQEAIHIKALSGGTDPAEITKEQALELAEAIKRLASTIAD
jgi:hypothetical protein